MKTILGLILVALCVLGFGCGNEGKAEPTSATISESTATNKNQPKTISHSGFSNEATPSVFAEETPTKKISRERLRLEASEQLPDLDVATFENRQTPSNHYRNTTVASTATKTTTIANAPRKNHELFDDFDGPELDYRYDVSPKWQTSVVRATNTPTTAPTKNNHAPRTLDLDGPEIG